MARRTKTPVSFSTHFVDERGALRRRADALRQQSQKGRVMGYAFVVGSCFGCGRVFSFHPNRVPSVTHNGTRKPICAQCVERANPLRIKNGLAPIVPLPGAYEVADENEIDWHDHD